MKNIKKIAMILFLLLLTSCANGKKDLKPGVYEGQGIGFNKKEPIKISVTINEKKKIGAVNILSHDETDNIGRVALEKLVEDVETKQDGSFDVISKATETSDGFRKALDQALEKARK